MAYVKNSIMFTTGGGGTEITVVANYSALPDPTTVSGQFYWCESSQGTSWLPGSLGGTYYNSGMYYSNGVAWQFMNVPYQATQTEVNTGTNTDKFVTPSTFANATKWSTKQDALTESNFGSFSNGLTAKTTIVDADSVNIVDSDDSNKAKKVTWLNVWTNYLKVKADAKYDVLPVLFEKHASVPTWGGTVLNNIEGFAYTITGGTARNFADTNTYTRRQRLGLTSAASGNLAQARQTATYFSRNSSLNIIVGLGFAENCTDANVRAFCGVSTTTLFTNVEPTTLLNCIGLAKLTTSNNLQLIHNDGSGTAVAIDLGASFPTNTVNTDLYTLQLITNGSNIDYLVTRINTGDTASGTISSDLPSASTALNLGCYVVQSSGVSATTGVDFLGSNILKS